MVVVVLQAQIDISSRRPFPGRQEKGMTIDTLVCDEPQKTLSSILQSREFNSQALDVIECFFGKDLGLDIPVLISVHCGRKIFWFKRDTLTRVL